MAALEGHVIENPHTLPGTFGGPNDTIQDSIQPEYEDDDPRALESTIRTLEQQNFQEELNGKFNLISEALRKLQDISKQGRETTIPESLEQIEQLLDTCLRKLKDYASSCENLGDYLSKDETTKSLKRYILREEYTKMCGILSIIDDYVCQCKRALEDFLEQYNAVSDKINELMVHAKGEKAELTKLQRVQERA